jgi:hypothetical protein
VTNRASHIQELTCVEDWNHVDSQKYPADLVSRGAEPNALKNLSLWCNGPLWLRPKNKEAIEVSEEEKNAMTVRQARIQRIIAYCLRFMQNCHNKDSRYQDPLTPLELNEATAICFKHAQECSYLKKLQN